MSGHKDANRHKAVSGHKSVVAGARAWVGRKTQAGSRLQVGTRKQIGTHTNHPLSSPPSLQECKCTGVWVGTRAKVGARCKWHKWALTAIRCNTLYSPHHSSKRARGGVCKSNILESPLLLSTRAWVGVSRHRQWHGQGQVDMSRWFNIPTTYECKKFKQIWLKQVRYECPHHLNLHL